ncbi:Thebaine 6-O-demethylase [Dichanthelium oligosanthes]|uniref:Thebaine 6-O-demethylase n=1 Tax=Dichanthelium oligosanthes TaxID=888268 RepID=A0A1E5VDM6_9POAL|nr:Thebaine 6-O-demethylase [Dichanthelium oligosanthes]
MSALSRNLLPEDLPSSSEGLLQPPPSPVIDLGRFGLDPATRSRVVDDVAKACRDLGYFQVINHGISQSVMDGAVEAASEFFKLPGKAATLFLMNFPFVCSNNSSFLFAETREYMGKYAVEVRRVALQLMEAILEGLGLGRGYLHEKFQEGLQLLALNCYPKVSQGGGTTVGLASHSDYGFLTILLTNRPGLEVADRSSSSWKKVLHLPHALDVHVGDHLEVLSNGRIKTVVHRAVLNPEEERISVASIHGFAMHEKVARAKELVDEQNPQKYKDSSFVDFLDHLTANMGDKNRNFLESLRM